MVYEIYDHIILDTLNAFSKRYPDKSHAYVNEKIISLWQKIVEMSPADAKVLENEIEQEMDYNSDKSKWTDLAVAYCIVYILYDQATQKATRKVLEAIASEFEEKTLEEALELLREPDL